MIFLYFPTKFAFGVLPLFIFPIILFTFLVPRFIFRFCSHRFRLFLLGQIKQDVSVKFLIREVLCF